MLVVCAVVAFVGILLVALGFTGYLEELDSRSVAQRAAQFTQSSDLANVYGPADVERGEKHNLLNMSALDKRLAKQSFAQKLALDLARADLRVTTGEFLVASGLLSFIFAVLIAAAVRLPILGILGVPIGIIIPRIFVGMRINGRRNRFNNQLPDTLTNLANSLRSGYSVLQAMNAIANDAPEPTRTEFRRIVFETGLGMPLQDALLALGRRLESDDVEIMVTAIGIQRDVGGNLAEVLDTIARTIRERAELKGAVSVLTAQQQMTGYVLAALPICLAGVLYMVAPKYMAGMLDDQCGIGLLGCALLLIVTGFFAMMRMVKIEV